MRAEIKKTEADRVARCRCIICGIRKAEVAGLCGRWRCYVQASALGFVSDRVSA
jgi:hypothetical protein